MLAAREAAAIPASASPSPLLFVLYDAGETLALRPVMERLDRRKIPYRVLVMGTARSLMVPKTGEQKIVDLADFGGARVSRTGWRRDKELAQSVVDRVAAKLGAKVVVTGLVSAAQKQIARAMRRRGARVVGFYDALQKMSAESYPSKLLPSLHRLLVAAPQLAPARKPAGTMLSVVGHPTLELWEKVAQKEDRSALRKTLGLTRKTLLYVGGYGKGYEQAFSLFAQAAARMQHIDVRVSLHPKVDGGLERSLLSKYGASNVQILPKQVATMRAAVAADLLVTQRSTVGVQALFLGRPVIFFDQHKRYSNMAIKNRLAAQLTSVDALLTASQKQLSKSSESPSTSALYKRARIPRNSAGRIATLLQKELRKAGKRRVRSAQGQGRARRR
jgi:hypothetical protein